MALVNTCKCRGHCDNFKDHSIRCFSNVCFESDIFCYACFTNYKKKYKGPSIRKSIYKDTDCDQLMDEDISDKDILDEDISDKDFSSLPIYGPHSKIPPPYSSPRKNVKFLNQAPPA